MAAERPCSQNTHGRAFPSREPAGRPGACPASGKTGESSHARDPQAGLPSPRPLSRGSGNPASSSVALTAPPGPGRCAHHDCGRPGAGPPGPLSKFSGPPAGAGGPTTAAAALARPSGPAPFPAASAARRAPRTKPHPPGSPAALNRRARTGAVLYPPVGHASPRLRSAAPRLVTSARTVLGFRGLASFPQAAGRSRRSWEGGRAVGRPTGERGSQNRNPGE